MKRATLLRGIDRSALRKDIKPIVAHVLGYQANLIFNGRTEYERLEERITSAPTRTARRSAQREMDALMNKSGLTVPVYAPVRRKRSKQYFRHLSDGRTFCLSQSAHAWRMAQIDSRRGAPETDADRRARILAKYQKDAHAGAQVR